MDKFNNYFDSVRLANVLDVKLDDRRIAMLTKIVTTRYQYLGELEAFSRAYGYLIGMADVVDRVLAFGMSFEETLKMLEITAEEYAFGKVLLELDVSKR